MTEPPVTTSSYLRVPRLISLQHPLSVPEEHDETLFIVIHQTYELWFKEILHELDKTKVTLSANRLFSSIATFKRLRSIMRTLVGQVDILETMTPKSFLAFRGLLDRSSGFESMQFREIECVLGHKRPEVLETLPPDFPGLDRVRRRIDEPTVVDALYELLGQRGVAVPAELLDRDVTQPNEPNEIVAEGCYELFMTTPQMAILFELMMDVDEGLQAWRYRHVQLTRRVIGNKAGTGGSDGAAFLASTMFHQVFPDLWSIAGRM